MKRWLEKFIAGHWNRRVPVPRRPSATVRGLDVGARIVDGELTRERVAIPQDRRAEAMACLGKTGTGKSSLLRHFAQQDIAAGRGFVYFDLHGDATSFLVKTVAAQERATRSDLSGRLIVIEPADPLASVGLNPLEQSEGHDRYVQIAEFAAVLKERWHLESFGARTDELLRNALYAIAENRMTLLEVAPLLSHADFRERCLRAVGNAEVRQFFETRYDQLSEAMRATMREPILNKISAFTADPHFRHIIGQTTSTFSIRDAMDNGYWVILKLEKGRLGEQAVTLGSLFLARIKNALFSRRTRQLFTVYCDEIQNLVAYGAGLETILSESRKFATSIASANQFLDQYPAEMRAAVLAVGTQLFFQLSSHDAQQIATALGGGKALGERLKNLPRRHVIVKTGHSRWEEALVPALHDPAGAADDLLMRSARRWARARAEVERNIVERRAVTRLNREEALRDWE